MTLHGVVRGVVVQLRFFVQLSFFVLLFYPYQLSVCAVRGALVYLQSKFGVNLADGQHYFLKELHIRQQNKVCARNFRVHY